MPIEITKTGATVVTGEKGIELYRLITLKSALKLEAHGLRVSRHVNARKIAKQVTGLKTNDRAKLLAAVEALIAELDPQVTRIVEGER